MELAFQIGLIVVLLVAFGLAMQPRYVFVVRVRDGVARLGSGKVQAGFVVQVEEACRRHGVRDGWVGGVRDGRRVALRFSRTIPSACQQQLRNEWTLPR